MNEEDIKRVSTVHQAIEQAENAIQKILIELEDETGMAIDSVDVLTREFADPMVWIYLK